MNEKVYDKNEHEFLEGLYKDYIKSSDSSYLRTMRELMISACTPFIGGGGRALELGCEIGYMTSLIMPLVDQLDVIDGSKSFLDEAKKKVPQANFFYMLFEDLSTEDTYDYVFMSHVVEHLQNPSDVLSKVYKALKKGGKLFVTVPNAEAASRQLAKEMGLVNDLYDLTPNDVRGGHRRVYDVDSIYCEIARAKFSVLDCRGILFKPFCDFQLDWLLDNGFLQKEHIDGLVKLGEKYRRLCADIFIVAEKV